jgi:hypothetical protein
MTRHRALPVYLATVAALAWEAAAFGQDRPITGNKDMTDTVRVTVTGDVVLDHVYRGPELNAFRFSASNNPPTAGPAVDTADSENTFEGHVALRIAAELSNKVSVVVEFGTRRIDNGEVRTFGAGAVGSAGSDAADLVLREAHVLLAECLTPGLSAQLGISTWSFDVRGRGHPLAFSPRTSQLITRNIDSLGPPGEEEIGDARLVEAGFPDVQDPVGATVTYASGAARFDLVVLPAVIEAGTASDDDALYAVDFWYALDDRGSRVGVIVVLSAFQMSGPVIDDGINENTAMWTVGGGFDLKGLIAGVELFGEVYFQFGDAGQFDVAGPATEDLEAGGLAFQAGFEWRHTVGNPMPIWAGASVVHFSGDDDAAGSGDTDVDRFAAYEGMNELMILESMDYGFDVDSNYTAFKIWAGTAFTAVNKDDLEVSALVGIGRASEDMNFAGQGEDRLGNELDLHLRWSMMKQLTLRVDAAFLFGSDVLERSMEATSPNNPDAEDNTMLLVMGLDLKF